MLCRGSNCLFQVFQGQVILSFVGSRHKETKMLVNLKRKRIFSFLMKPEPFNCSTNIY